MAEIEFSALARQCLDKRIGSLEEMKTLTAQWTEQRNRGKVKIHWSFTVEGARDKLASQYRKVNDKN